MGGAHSGAYTSRFRRDSLSRDGASRTSVFSQERPPKVDAESEGIMGPHTTLIPKVFKLDAHLGYMQVPLSTDFPIKTCLL